MQDQAKPGMMQDWPLLCHRVIEHAARQHGGRRVVTRSVEGPIKVTNYAQVHQRALRVSKRLTAEGIQQGDIIGTLAWSTANHLECWYGITGIGAIYHPVNPRLFPEQIAYIINDAKDRILMVDTSFIAVLESLADRLPSVERYVILTDREHMPRTTLRNAIAYEDWLAEADADFEWRTFEENTAASLAYTSGTTGQPKGVLYSHRSIVLMSLAANSPDMYGFSANDVVLQVVPMCHANGWSWPFSAPMAGASLVFPGPALDGASLTELLVSERVTLTGGVPTVWQGVLNHLEQQGQALAHLKRIYIGGSPCSQTMIEAFTERHGAEVRSAFGMTEMGPMGAIASTLPETRELTGSDMIKLRQSQGRPPFLVEFRTCDDDGKVQPWDGESAGHLKARGPCIVQSYYGTERGSALDVHGFFDTGDIATINPNGYVRLTDRAKDLVKSGGEWISSIDLENHAMDHPDVMEAAVIAARHPKWDERPLLIVVPRPGRDLSKEEILRFLDGRVAKWWLPDDIVFVDSLPHTATGKLHKSVLRKEFENFLLTKQEN
ncbi:MAG: long-chain fatty acid--CoA ligase [Herminiimonas sp.]|nr:long-chain fatty acid--CoA ligase [Herminiimonas sp.]